MEVPCFCVSELSASDYHAGQREMGYYLQAPPSFELGDGRKRANPIGLAESVLQIQDGLLTPPSSMTKVSWESAKKESPPRVTTKKWTC